MSAVTPELADTVAGPAALRRPRSARERIGRYKIVRQLGQGGMGVVWEASDPELGRGVAIKVLHETRLGNQRLAERLRREAQALARLHHANVVAVYDVGVDDGELYIVMQLIAGTTLDKAITGKREREIVELFVRAGRGLEAAHAAGIVHRDFKPTNVLVDADGTPRVTDFGLARASDTTESTDEHAEELTSSGGLGTSMTRGELVGTPAYMAPEQFQGGLVTPATDQFSFCVALWEALAGTRPFPGSDVATVRDAVTSGRRAEMPARIPRRIRAALARGLAFDPKDRFPSMTELLAELAPSRRVVWIAGGVGVAALVTAALLLGTTHTVEDPCAGVDQPADAVWNAKNRAALRTSLGEQANPAIVALDGLTARWKATRSDACRATHVRNDGQTAAELGERYTCLDHVLAGERAAIELLAGKPDPLVIARARDIVDQITQPEQCTRQAATVALGTREHTVKMPDDLYQQVAHLHAAFTAGRFTEVTSAAAQLTPRVEAVGDPATLSDWLYLLSRAQQSLGDMPAARKSLRASAEAGLRAGHDDYATHAWTDLAALTAQLGDLDTVDDLLAAARGAAARTDPSNPNPQLWVELATARVALERADSKAALAGCQHVSELANQHGLQELAREARGCTIDAYAAMGDGAKALDVIRAQLEIDRKQLGPDHPEIVSLEQQLAAAMQQAGDRTGAKPIWDRVFAATERLYGATSIEMMQVLRDFANAETPAGAESTPEALAAIERAVAIADKVLTERDPRHAAMLEALGYVQSALHHEDKALAAYERAIELYEKTDDPAALSRVLYNTAASYQATDRCDRAIPMFRRAAKIGAETGKKSTMSAAALYGEGACLGKAKQYAEAEVALRESIDQLDKLDEPLFGAQSRWELADQLVQRGQRAPGLEMAKAAAAQLQGRPPPAEDLRKEILAWVKKHERRGSP